MRHVWKALLVTGLGLCSRGPSADAAAPGATLVLRECRLEHPLRLASVSARCGLLPVPEDRSHPGGATLDLSVAVVPALNRRADAAPLFLLAGGPGQGATMMYVTYSAAFARVNRDHDIVLVDQRGTGKSSPLSCDYPEDWQAPDDALTALRQATSACLKKYGERVRFYTHRRGRSGSFGRARSTGLPHHRSVRRVLWNSRGAAVHATLSPSRSTL